MFAEPVESKFDSIPELKTSSPVKAAPTKANRYAVSEEDEELVVAHDDISLDLKQID